MEQIFTFIRTYTTPHVCANAVMVGAMVTFWFYYIKAQFEIIPDDDAYINAVLSGDTDTIEKIDKQLGEAKKPIRPFLWIAIAALIAGFFV